MEQPMKQYKTAEKLELKEIKEDFPVVFNKVYCPSCEAEVTAENINLQHMVAKCGSCNVVFSIEDEVESLKTKKEMKQEVFRPEGIDLFYFKDDLEITIQQHLHGLDLFGVIILPTFSFLSILIYFAKDIPIVIPFLLSLGAIYFIYKAFNYTNNKTYIDINSKFLSIKYRPKNLKKDRTYAVDEIAQLYLKHAVDGSGYYTINMIIDGLEGQRHEKLLTANTLSKAKYLEQEIERYLNIENTEVPDANV